MQKLILSAFSPHLHNFILFVIADKINFPCFQRQGIGNSTAPKKENMRHPTPVIQYLESWMAENRDYPYQINVKKQKIMEEKENHGRDGASIKSAQGLVCSGMCSQA
jgi:hypothetical protein